MRERRDIVIVCFQCEGREGDGGGGGNVFDETQHSASRGQLSAGQSWCQLRWSLTQQAAGSRQWENKRKTILASLFLNLLTYN